MKNRISCSSLQKKIFFKERREKAKRTTGYKTTTEM